MTNDQLEKKLANVPERLKEAQMERMKTAGAMDDVVFHVIQRYQNLTLKQIESFFEKAEMKGYPRSFLLNSLRRLEEDKKIFSRTTEDAIHGKLTKIYFIKSNESLDVTSVKIRRNEFMPFLDNNPAVFAIKDDEIWISPEDDVECQRESIFFNPAKTVDYDYDYLLIKLPDKFIKFYKLDSGKYYFKKLYQKNRIILQKKMIFKSDEFIHKKNKKIVILEDSKIFGKRLEKKLKIEGHNPIVFLDEKKFMSYLKQNGKSVDVISLDKKIKSKNIADKISYEIRYNAPQAKIGLLTVSLSRKEKMLYQDLNFDFILNKEPNPDIDFPEIGDELVAWLKVV